MKIKERILRDYPALSEKNIRLYIYGQFISFCGTWMQGAGEAWQVNEMTHSAQWVTFIASLMFLPSIVLAPFGGSMIDRFDKRFVLYITNWVSALQAFVLAALVLSGNATPWRMAGLAFVLGVVTAIDAPARRLLINEISPTKEIVGAASAFNVSLITLGQLVGPALATIIIPIWDTGPVFVINGFSFLAVIVTMQKMTILNPLRHTTKHAFAMVWDGIKFAASEKFIRFRLFLILFLSTFGFSYRSVLAVLTEKTFHGHAGSYGLLMACAGAGSCTASLIIARSAKNVLPFKFNLLFGTMINGTSLLALGFVSSVQFASVLLFMTGFGFIMAFATVRATLQQIIRHPEYQKMGGRVMGLDYGVFFGGIAPGNSLLGVISERYSCSVAVACCGIVLLGMGGVFTFLRGNIHAHE